jgi:cell division protein FtsX
MARILILAVIAVVLFGGILAADQALSNPDTAVDTANTTQQDEFAEVGVSILDAAPLALFALVVGVAIAAVGRVG